MSQPTNKRLYEAVKQEAKRKYKRYPSLYASAWIVKEYKKRGGKYKGEKPTGGVDRWFEEQWVQVIPFLKSGRVVECGEQTRDTKACRPLKRVDNKTPITMTELIKLHSKADILDMARRKNKNMKRRVDWKKLEFY